MSTTSPPSPLPPSAPPSTKITTTPEPPRKFPKPCWTQEETLALINIYQHKWYSLRRRNLRTSDWDTVAENVAKRCPNVSPPKTSAQCRHKMEKLRKRYRTDKQRGLSLPDHRCFVSSWIFYNLIDSMETGSSIDPDSQNGHSSKDVNKPSCLEDKFSAKIDEIIKGKSSFKDDRFAGCNGNFGAALPVKAKLRSYGSSIAFDANLANDGDHEFGVWSSGMKSMYSDTKGSNYGKTDTGFGFNGKNSMPRRKMAKLDDAKFDPKHLSGVYNRRGEIDVGGDGGGANRGMEDPAAEMASSIKMLGDGFVKMEKMKIEMVREIECMRMKMEMKRSEMILQSQQVIVNAFVERLIERKKRKVKVME